jgi:hypothetical protein
MMKWGDWEQIDVRTLRRANAVLAHQQKIGPGPVIATEAYSPASIISTQASARALEIMNSAGPIVALGSVALNHFMLGVLYVLCSQGEMDASIREITGDATHGDDDEV